jgi:gas vesicle protein
MIFRDLLEHLNRQKEIERQKETCRNVAIGAAVGTLVGLTVGILFAPRSGKETRKAIADKTVDTAGHVKEVVSVYADEIRHKAHEAGTTARQTIDSAKESVHELIRRAQQGAEDGEEAADATREMMADKLEDLAETVKPK